MGYLNCLNEAKTNIEVGVEYKAKQEESGFSDLEGAESEVKADDTAHKNTNFLHCRQEDIYFNFNRGGINYGPRHRLIQEAMKIGYGGDLDPPSGVKISSAALRNSSHCADWELSHNWHPGILDCALQCGAAFSFGRETGKLIQQYVDKRAVELAAEKPQVSNVANTQAPNSIEVEQEAQE
mmetsp:Transcript_82089/g.129281  ORF Transcript_82089/g.129281 Transcript_82089/m.129281 type:complete len:181 (+) Transcript_82089:79-621(+)